MSKTIGAEISQDKSNEIEEHCKKNNITKSDFVKNSINNAMNQGVVSEQKQPIPTEPTKKDIRDMSISEINESLKKEYEAKRYSKNDIENQIKPQIKRDTKNDVINHMKNKNCGFGCDICDTRRSIKNIGMKEQEDKDSKLFSKKIPSIQNQSYINGIFNGIKTMYNNSGEDPKDVYNFVIQKSQIRN